MIHVGVDLHQRFCYMTALDSSGRQISAQAVDNRAEALRAYLRQFGEKTEVAVEACSFWPAFAAAVEPVVARLVLVHPARVKAIASAKLKNDRVDARTLAHLLRCDLLPEAWRADEATRALRQQVRLRATLVRQRTRLKNQVHAVLHQQGARHGFSDLFGKRGRVWLAELELPPMARHAVEAYCGLIDQIGVRIAEEDRAVTERAREDGRARWLRSIPGIGDFSALLLLAELGDAGRFRDKEAVASYAGLVPWVRESADRRRRGSITRCGSPWLRWIMVEAVPRAVKSSPAVRRYYDRLRARKHAHVARVAVARKLLIAAWALLRDGVLFEEARFA